MTRSAADFGRIVVALSLLGFAVENVLFGRYVVARVAPWPDDPSTRFAVACATALVFLVAGTALLTKRFVRPAALAAASLMLGWSIARHLPVAIAGPAWSGDWTNVLKASAFAAGAVGVAASHGEAPGAVLRALRILAPYVLGAFFLLCGIQHFMYARWVATMIPWFIPGALAWTYVAGVLLMAAGLAFWTPGVRRIGAVLAWLMVFSWVFLVHVPLLFTVGRGEWLGVFEALGISGACLALAAPADQETGARSQQFRTASV